MLLHETYRRETYFLRCLLNNIPTTLHEAFTVLKVRRWF